MKFLCPKCKKIIIRIEKKYEGMKSLKTYCDDFEMFVHAKRFEVKKPDKKRIKK
jgi:hypothetical protein